MKGDTEVFSRRHGYAGALDCLGRSHADGRLVVVDFKTSGGVYNGHGLQLAAYVNAVREMYGDGELDLSHLGYALPANEGAQALSAVGGDADSPGHAQAVAFASAGAFASHGHAFGRGNSLRERHDSMAHLGAGVGDTGGGEQAPVATAASAAASGASAADVAASAAAGAGVSVVGDGGRVNALVDEWDPLGSLLSASSSGGGSNSADSSDIGSGVGGTATDSEAGSVSGTPAADAVAGPAAVPAKKPRARRKNAAAAATIGTAGGAVPAQTDNEWVLPQQEGQPPHLPVASTTATVTGDPGAPGEHTGRPAAPVAEPLGPSAASADYATALGTTSTTASDCSQPIPPPPTAAALPFPLVRVSGTGLPLDAMVVRIDKRTGAVAAHRVRDLPTAWAAFRAALQLWHVANSGRSLLAPAHGPAMPGGGQR
jgi:hypothetical protein